MNYKRRDFYLGVATILMVSISMYLLTATLLDGDLVTALWVPGGLISFFVVLVKVIGRRYPNYYLYKGTLDVWSALQERRSHHSS